MNILGAERGNWKREVGGKEEWRKGERRKEKDRKKKVKE